MATPLAQQTGHTRSGGGAGGNHVVTSSTRPPSILLPAQQRNRPPGRLALRAAPSGRLELEGTVCRLFSSRRGAQGAPSIPPRFPGQQFSPWSKSPACARRFFGQGRPGPPAPALHSLVPWPTLGHQQAQRAGHRPELGQNLISLGTASLNLGLVGPAETSRPLGESPTRRSPPPFRSATAGWPGSWDNRGARGSCSSPAGKRGIWAERKQVPAVPRPPSLQLVLRDRGHALFSKVTNTFFGSDTKSDHS